VRALSVPEAMLFWWETERDCADRIYKVVLRARISPTGLSSPDVTVLAETFHEVCSHNKTFPRPLKPLVVRP